MEQEIPTFLSSFQSFFCTRRRTEEEINYPINHSLVSVTQANTVLTSQPGQRGKNGYGLATRSASMSTSRPDFENIKKQWTEAGQEQVFKWEDQLSEEAKIELYAQLQVWFLLAD